MMSLISSLVVSLLLVTGSVGTAFGRTNAPLALHTFIAHADAQTDDSALNQEIKDAHDRLLTLRTQKTSDTLKNRLEHLQDYGDKAFTVRSKVLENKSSNLPNSECSEEAKTIIQNSINSIVAQINTQKTALDGATTSAQALSIIKNTITNTRVFMHWQPASRQLCITSRLQTFVSVKLNNTITKLKGAGLDTTSIETKRDEVTTKLAQAFDLFKYVVQNPGASDAQTKLDQGHALLKDVRRLLGDIKSDIGNLKGDYEKKIKATATTEQDDTSKTAD